MKNKYRTFFLRLLIPAGCCTLLFINGCSSGFSLTEWMPSRKSVVSRPKVADKDINRFASAIRPWQGDSESLYRLAVHLQKQNLHLAAIDDFKRLLSIDPGFVKAYNGIGISCDCMGDYTSAIQAYQTALKINPDLAYIHNNLGYARLLSGDLNGAIETFREAIRLDTSNPKYHNNLAVAYAENRQLDPAFEEFRKSMDQQDAAHNLIRILYRKGWVAEADYYSRFLSVEKTIQTNETVSTVETNPLYASESHSPVPSYPALNPSGGMAEKSQPLIAAIDTSLPVPVGSTSDQTTDNLSFTVADTPQKNVPAQTRTEYPDNPNCLNTAGQKPAPMLRADSKKKRIVVKDPGIEVSNGNGVNQMATRFGRYLKNKGFHVTAVTNANHFNHQHTMIYYCRGHLHDAYEVAKKIPGYQNMEKVDELGKPDIHIRVLIGKDLIGFNQLFPKN